MKPSARGVSVDVIVWHHLTLGDFERKKIIVNGDQLLQTIKQLLDFYTKYLESILQIIGIQSEVYSATIVSSMRCFPAI